MRNVILLDALQLDADVLAAFDARHFDFVRPKLKIINTNLKVIKERKL